MASAFDEAVGEDYGEDGDGAEADDDAGEEGLGDGAVHDRAVGDVEEQDIIRASIWNSRSVNRSSEEEAPVSELENGRSTFVGKFAAIFTSPKGVPLSVCANEVKVRVVRVW